MPAPASSRRCASIISRKLQVLPLSFVQSRQTGDLLSRGLADTTQLQNTLTLLANDGVKQPGVPSSVAIGFLTLVRPTAPRASP
jgi:ABC-type multidrug transport system fused ATPase/permease subunit